MQYCPLKSQILVGPIKILFRKLPSERRIVKKNPYVQPGGYYRPPHCIARYKSAIIIPHRNRELHLWYLLYYLHPFLQRQQLQYGIYVVHQAGNGTFNRAKLLNVGVKEALKNEDWDCLIMHDVDLIPENDNNFYICDHTYPKHMSSAMDKFKYRLPYWTYFGGVSAMTPEQYLRMNGFPNTYWGWGGEDDDIAMRIQLSGMTMSRTPLSLGRYKMVAHIRDEGNEENLKRYSKLRKTRRTWKEDGMNSLTFQLISREETKLYTNITVDIGDISTLPPVKAKETWKSL
ncbi:beta-1,4-galactosyltransferase 3-like isoform X2 [Rhinatrema bivittatum]|nr:beta-1,4-galactosyltransferase 3-like isoform X2 [Rhinatrema bivittatum]XP_029434269.1 beta-1,4-galactosyltransferase 3-like isoform X2 [Rhinatrema bivittatum]